jgi:protein-L-isoaspartate O-methyltransferase
MLIELPLTPTDRPMPELAEELLAAGRARFKSVDCFDFVPSDYELACRTLDALPRGRFCEWGSGMGLVTGMAEILGFDAYGIEIDADLAERSRALLSQFGLSAHIETGDYLSSSYQADFYYVYCWPGKVVVTEAHFQQIAPPGAYLLILNGESDIRLKIRAPQES